MRGSADYTPLTSAGKAQAKRLGQAFARRGCLTCLYLSTALRVRQTANAIVEASGNKTELEDPTPDILSWRMGGLEGSPMTEVQPKLEALVRYLPSQAPNGRSDITDLPGESFDDFRWRALPYVAKQMLEWWGNKKLKLGIVGHHRVLKLVNAWFVGGCSPLFDIDKASFLKPQEMGKPGDVWQFVPTGGVNDPWKAVPFNPYADGELPASVYYVRHADTALNSGSYSG